VIDILSGADGSNRGAEKIARLRRNTRMFREGLKMMVCGACMTRGDCKHTVAAAAAAAAAAAFLRP
jgi:hypothetical protein